MGEARRRSDRPGVAESLELRAFCSEPPEPRLLEEALTIWSDLGAEVAAARAELALARLAGNRLEAERARRELRSLGVGETASRAAGILMALGPEEAPPLELQTLGGFRVLRNGIPVSHEAWKSKKARDLLKLLVARRGRPVSRDEAIETLWPEEDPARTGNRLSVALSTLRSVLDPNHEFPPGHFVAAENGVLRLLPENATLDVDAFLAQSKTGLTLARTDRHEALAMLEAAEAAYTGDFLEEDRYEDWAEPLRNESRASYVEVLRTLAAETRLPKYFFRIIERDAFDEGAHLGLVTALEAEGAHGEARRAYRTYLSRMQEIGAEPAPFPEVGSSSGERART